jgi:hypothetical protein
MPPTLSSQRIEYHRLADYFRDRMTRAGLLARRLLGLATPQDAELAEHLIRERRHRTRLDGSMDGALVPTAWAAWELLQLGAPADNAGVVRTIGFLLGRQDQPGRIFGEGCRPYTHEHRICCHYLSGFFSAGPEESPIAPLTFPTGVTIAGEREARFAASCFALRSVIRAGEDGREGVRRHVASLLQLPEVWSGSGTELWNQNLAFFALGGVALAPLDLREAAARAVAQVAGQQRPDGTWEGADLLHALDMLLLAPTQEARTAVRRAAPAVASLLKEETLLEGTAGEERGLIALRALASATLEA